MADELSSLDLASKAAHYENTGNVHTELAWGHSRHTLPLYSLSCLSKSSTAAFSSAYKRLGMNHRSHWSQAGQTSAALRAAKASLAEAATFSEACLASVASVRALSAAALAVLASAKALSEAALVALASAKALSEAFLVAVASAKAESAATLASLASCKAYASGHANAWPKASKSRTGNVQSSVQQGGLGHQPRQLEQRPSCPGSR